MLMATLFAVVNLKTIYLHLFNTRFYESKN
jgi:hypothetical protein